MVFRILGLNDFIEQFLGFKQSVHLHFVKIRRRAESTERRRYIGVEGGKTVRKNSGMWKTTSRKEKLRRVLLVIFGAGVIALAGVAYQYVKNAVPDRINVVVDRQEEVRFGLPFRALLESESEEVLLNGSSKIPSDQIHLQLNQPFSIYSEQEGTYRLSLKLFGIWKLKDIEVDVSDVQYAVPCGLPVGIYMKSDGLMVIGTGKVTAQTGEVMDPADGILRSGDYIEAINGTPATDKKDMIRAVKEAGNMALTLSVRREGEKMDVQMTPVQTQEGDYKLGLWIRDDTQGIGTMTYVCANGAFGALGHGISDGDTGLLVQTSGGELYDTEILGVEKGSFGKPGVMSGVIYYGNQSRLGSVESNTDQGIFGMANPRFLSRVKNPAIPIGYRQDVKKGRACIRSSVSGELKDYEIEIQKIDHSSNRHNKDMVIRVTDPELLSLTGGIVQGMSGSPIIQNGKLIGAVTHVFIQDSTRGYGILVENMLGH